MSAQSDELNDSIFGWNEVLTRFHRYANEVHNDSSWIGQGKRLDLGLLRNHDLEEEDGTVISAFSINDDIHLLLRGEGRSSG